MFTNRQIWHLYYLILCSLLLIPSWGKDPIDNLKKINEMNLLFPHTQENRESLIQYKLIAYNGCYDWSSTSQSYFQIKGIPDENKPKCHSSAIVSLVNSKPINQAIWIIAKDIETGDVLRVEAKIAEIAKIEIITKSRTIDVGEMQALEIVGFDKNGNMFSTMEGVKFEWGISRCDSVLELVSIKDSLIKATELRKKLEAQLIQTDIIIVKGLTPGNCQINAKLTDKDYKINPTSVRMHVMEQFTILPESELFVLRKCILKFKIALIKREESNTFLKEINIPNPNYFWSLNQKDLGSIQQNGVLQIKNELGSLKVIVNDQKSENFVENIVHIVAADQMELNIKEIQSNQNEINENEIFDNVWNLIVGKRYLVRAALFDYLHNPITITENLNFKFIFGNKEYFEITSTTNKDIIFVPKRKVEKLNLKGELEEGISCEKVINVYSQIKMIKPDNSLHLPALVSFNEKEIQSSFKLFVIGGSGSYEWVSENLDIAIVSQEGLIKSKTKGKTWIEVHDRLNLKNKEKIEIDVTNIAHLRSLEEMKEILVNSSDHIYIIAEDEDHRIYSNCSSFQFDIQTIYEDVFTTRLEYHSYGVLLNNLDNLSNEYKSFRILFQLLLKNKKMMEISNYEKYIHEKEITYENLNEIIKFYSNYGVCSKLIIFANYPSELTTKIISPLANLNFQSSLVQIRLVENFKIIQPKLEIMNQRDLEIVLSSESSFEWQVEGGPNIWEETRKLNEKYEVEDQILGKATTNHFLTIINLSKPLGQKIKRHYYTKCNLPKDSRTNQLYSIKLFSWNEPDTKLLKPVNVSLVLNVSCKIPSKLQIYTFEPYETPLNVYNAKILGFEAVNLKNYADHFFQVFAYDENLVPFYNFSSLEINWKIMKPTNSLMLSRIDFQDYEGICRICEDQFIKLAVKDCNEELILRAETFELKKIFQKFLFPLLWDEIALSFLPNLQLTPQKIILYNDIRNTAQIKISYGSGYFIVKTNDSELLTFEYDRISASITVSPLKKGYAKIIVEDAKLQLSKRVSCDILISEAFSMRLKTETNLLPIGNQTLMEVNVLENNYDMIPVEQYHLMTIHLQIEVDSEYLKNNALKITKYMNEKHIFLVEGLLVGSFKVKAFMIPQHMPTNYISSNLVELHIFDTMKVNPNELLIAPGCLSTVELLGGPSEKSKVLNNVILEASLNYKNIVTFKELNSGLYEIYGQNTGKVEMTFILKYKHSNKIISSVSLSIKVALVDDVQILGMVDRKLHIGSVVRLIAISKYEKEIFSHGICNFAYSWKSSDPNVLYIPAPPITMESQINNWNTENFLNIAVNASALAEGTSDIILTVETKYERKFNTNTFTTSVKVRVIEPLATDIPINFNQKTAQPALLLIPPHSGYRLVTNKEASKLKFNYFSGQSEKEINIDSLGYIKTSQYNGKYSFLVEDYGVEKQLMVINILVTNIFSIILENSYKVLYLPTDSEIRLKIILQDFFGRHFPKNIDNIEFGLHVTNPKAIDLKILNYEQILIVKAKSVGSSICFIYLEENPNVYDIFLINVGSIVTPSSPVYVHVGGVIYFTANRKQNNEYKWTSEDPQIVEINNQGKAIALKEGKTNILISDTIHHLTKINVYKASKILLNEARSPYKITNIPTNPNYREEYHFYFRVISDERELKFLNNIGKTSTEQINNNLKFECESKDELIQVKAEIAFDEIENQQIPKCIVIMKHDYGTHNSKRSGAIKVSVLSHSPNTFYLSQEFSIDVIPEFHIANRDYLVELNRDRNSKMIVIDTVDDLSYQANNEYINHNMHSKFDSTKNLFFLNITLPENKLIKKTIESDLKIFNIFTNQTEIIKIIYDPNLEGVSNYIDSSSTFSWLDGIIAVICLLVLVIIANQFMRQSITITT